MLFVAVLLYVAGLHVDSTGATFTYAASKHRQEKILDVDPYRILKDLSLVQCLTVCYGQDKCESFNYGNSECHLLDTYLCKGDPDRKLTDKPGFSYYDTMEFSNSEDNRLPIKSCKEFSRCSSRCPKYRLLTEKKPLLESIALCEAAGGFLAQPANLEDHRQITRIAQAGKIKSVWIGVQKMKNSTETTFVFSEGNPFAGERPFPSDLWGDEQPNNTGGKQDCVEMLSDMKFKWNDVECDKKNPFVCQFSR